MKTLLTAGALFVGCSLVAPAHASAADLNIGDNAPALSISEWLKGEPVDGFEEGHVYVVEFWATWCGPCIAGMPHVSELQEKYEDDVTVIGVNIWEREPEKVPAWMESRGAGQPSGDELMQYTVGMQEGTLMAEQWMEAAGANGIPTAFIVDRDAKIAWIGHPMSMDEPLADVVAGTWDPSAAMKARRAAQEAERRADAERAAFMEKAGPALERVRNSDGHAKIEALEEVMAAGPPATFGVSYMMAGVETYMIELDDAAGARAFIERHKAYIWDDANMLNSISWNMLTGADYDGHRCAETALMLADRAHELTDESDAMIMDTVARAHFLKAIEIQRAAVEYADGPLKASLQSQLEIFEKAYAEQPEG